MLAGETARCSQRHGCDDGVLSELALLVGLHTHSVVAVAVVVEEHAVEYRVGCALNTISNLYQGISPRQRVCQPATLRAVRRR